MTALRHLLRLALAILAVPLLMAATPLTGSPPPPGKAVWYGIYFLDTSGEGERADQTARIKTTEDFIADDLTTRGFTLIAPPADAMASIKNPAQSNHRDTKIAAGLGARYAISAEVQKVSNLILSLKLYVRDAQTGGTVRAGTVDIRGNTDESFRRGYSYLLRNIIFREK